MFSATLRVGASVSSCVIVTMPRSSASFDEPSTRSTPSTSMRPASGASAPEATRASVDFPEPFPPVRACTTPAWSVRSTSSRASTPGKRLVIPVETQQGWIAAARQRGSRSIGSGAPAAAAEIATSTEKSWPPWPASRSSVNVSRASSPARRGTPSSRAYAVEHVHVLDHQLDGEVGVDASREHGARQPVAQDPARAAAAGDRLAHLVEVGAGLGGEREAFGDPDRGHRAHQVVRELRDLAVSDRPDVHGAPERLEQRQAARVRRIRASGHDRQVALARRDRAAADRRVEHVDAARREPSCQILRRGRLHRAEQQQRGAVAQPRLEPALAAERRLDLRRVGKHHEHDVAPVREVARRVGRGDADARRGRPRARHGGRRRRRRGPRSRAARRSPHPARRRPALRTLDGGQRDPTPSSRRAEPAPRSPLRTANAPLASTSSTKPRGTTIVVLASSTIAGPASRRGDRQLPAVPDRRRLERALDRIPHRPLAAPRVSPGVVRAAGDLRLLRSPHAR